MPDQNHSSAGPGLIRTLPILIAVFALSLSGCGLARIAKGQYYLNQGKYEQGRVAFQEALHTHPEDAGIHYYMGRLYLADDMPGKALPYLKEAVRLSPDTADYHFWLGVGHSALGHSKAEAAEYRNALNLNSRHVQARVYLGHSLLEKKQYTAALHEYEEVLRFSPDHPAALYNRALCLRGLRRPAEEKTAWLEYLSYYDTGSLARNASEHLNGLGDFSYRNHVLGMRTVTLRAIDFEPLSATLTSQSTDALRRLGYFLLKAHSRTTLHVLAYQAGNKNLAKQKAVAVKNDILRRFPAIARNRIRISWFGTPEKVTAGTKQFRLTQSINVFATK